MLPLEVHTHPRSVRVYLEAPDVALSYLGTSDGTPRLPVPPEFLQDDRPTLDWRLVFQQDGYKTQRIPVELRHHLHGNAVRYDDEITLLPATWLVALRDSPLTWGWIALLGLAGGIWWHRARRPPPQASVDPQAADPWLGKTVDRWTLLELLGRGGMATVYRGVPTESLNRAESVAIKIMHPEIAEDHEAISRFHREIRVCCELSHPGIVRVLDWGTGELHYMVMDFVEGRTLRHSVRPPGLPLAEVRRLLGAIFAAVSFAHDHGVHHRDLKPENIMLTSDGRPMIMDFGVARGLQDHTVTQDGRLPGTLGYMGPEQLRGEKKVGAASDQYALGVIVYELICGNRPFDADETGAIIYGTLIEPPPPLPQRPHLNAVLQQMLAKKPDERFGSVAEAWQALDAAFDKEQP